MLDTTVLLSGDIYIPDECALCDKKTDSSWHGLRDENQGRKLVEKD